MAKAQCVGQVAEWFKATVLKTPQGHRLKAPNSRVSNSYRPRMTRTERTAQRFAMAQMSAHHNRAGISAPTEPSPNHKAYQGGFMADSFPKQILPYLEGRIGELRKMRFWSKVNMRGPDECWDWQASLTESGYGRFKIASYTTVVASRFALISTKGVEPSGMLVMHRCDRPRCCNPNHLRFGTVADNNNDKILKGRQRGKCQVGFANVRAKLSHDELSLIVDGLKARKNNCEIAREVGTVGHAMISRIRVGRSWQEEVAALGWPQ